MAKRKKLLMGNWKMNHLISDAISFSKAITENNLVEVAKKKDVILAVAPTYLSLEAVKKNAPGLIVSSQDCHYASHGAFTSSISVEMLKEIGVTWSIVGHSEKRQYEGETDLDCNRKIKTLVNNDFTAVYCVGETNKEYEDNLTKDVILAQVRTGLQNISKDKIKNVVIAYEPVWSIGTGKNASKEIAEDICSFIRNVVKDMYCKDVADNMLILYGGSVKPENIHDYLACEDVDGALVGGASLKAESFKALVDNI